MRLLAGFKARLFTGDLECCLEEATGDEDVTGVDLIVDCFLISVG